MATTTPPGPPPAEPQDEDVEMASSADLPAPAAVPSTHPAHPPSTTADLAPSTASLTTTTTTAAATTTATTTTTAAAAAASISVPQEPADPSPAAQPGPRAARMQQLYAQSLRRALGKLGWDNFAACFPTVAARAEPVLRQVQAQMVEKLGDKCEKEFEHIMTARQVVPKLNELEALVADASRRRASSSPDSPPIPPHTLPPATILAAHLLPSLASHQSHLNARLQTTQSRNALLHAHILRQRADIDALLADLEHAVDDVRGANAVLGAVVEDIAREAREGGVDVDVDVEG